MNNPDLQAVYDRVLEAPASATGRGVRALVSAQMMAYFSTLGDNEPGFVAAYRLVMRAIGRHITWYRTEAMRRSRVVKPKDLDAFEVWFGPGRSTREEYELVLGSGPTPGEIGPWGFRFAVDRLALPEVLGYFQFTLPARYARERPDEFRGLARSVFESAAFVSAHAGLAVSFDPGDLDPERDSDIRALCARFMGLDCTDVLSETEALADAIKGADWLTFLGPRLAERVGGAEGLSAELAGHAIVKSLGARGLMVQAGPVPILGDRHAREDVAAYQAVDQALRAIRVEQLHPLPGFEDETDTAAWLERFERAD